MVSIPIYFQSIPFIHHPSFPGGDVNIADSDGDTPLYTVENLETARFLVQQGAVVARHNNEGISVCIYHVTTQSPFSSFCFKSQ